MPVVAMAGSPPPNVSASKSWNARTTSCVAATISCGRLPLVLRRRYIGIARQTTEPRNRLSLAFTPGLQITALDALLFFGVQRVASDVSVLRKEGLNIGLQHVNTFDSATQVVRPTPVYFPKH